MRSDLQSVLDILRAHEADLRRLGVAHAAVFGSVARGEARAESDIDVLVDLDENRPMGIFEYARMNCISTNSSKVPVTSSIGVRSSLCFGQIFARRGSCLLRRSHG